MIKSVFIIGTEHQMLQVKEAINYFQFKSEDYIVLFFSKENDTIWTGQKANQYKIKNFHLLDNWVFKDIFLKRRRPINFITLLKELRKNGIENLFFSQYKNDSSLLAIKILNPKNVILMDEGTASIKIASERSKNINRNVKRKLIFKSLIYCKSLKHPTSLTYFTQYDLHLPNTKADKSIKYKFTIIDNKCEIDANLIFLLGSSVSELNLVSENYYFGILNKIISQHKKEKLIYFSHRKENALKLEKIEKLGFEVVKNKEPFENLFGKLEIIPVILYSFYSPILPNLSKLYKNTPKKMIIKLEDREINFNNDIISKIYDEYEKDSNINIVDFYRLNNEL